MAEAYHPLTSMFSCNLNRDTMLLPVLQFAYTILVSVPRSTPSGVYEMDELLVKALVKKTKCSIIYTIYIYFFESIYFLIINDSLPLGVGGHLATEGLRTIDLNLCMKSLTTRPQI